MLLPSSSGHEIDKIQKNIKIQILLLSTFSRHDSWLTWQHHDNLHPLTNGNIHLPVYPCTALRDSIQNRPGDLVFYFAQRLLSKNLEQKTEKRCKNFHSESVFIAFYLVLIFLFPFPSFHFSFFAVVIFYTIHEWSSSPLNTSVSIALCPFCFVLRMDKCSDKCEFIIQRF